MKFTLLVLLMAIFFSFESCTSVKEKKVVNNTEEIDLKILPTPRTAVLKEEGYIVWGASMVQDKNGLNHLFYCRWKGTLSDWTRSSEIVHATSDNPLGPFTPQEVALGREPEGEDLWCGIASFNPCVVEFDGKYYFGSEPLDLKIVVFPF